MDILSGNNPIVDIYEYIENNTNDKLIGDISNAFKNKLCSQTTKCNLLSSALALKRYTLEDFLFYSGEYGLKDILRSCFILDTTRYVKQLEKKLAVFTKQNNARKVKYLTHQIKSNKKMDQGLGKENGFTLNNPKIKRIKKKWVNMISRQDLEMDALNMPKRQWQRLADILHLSKNDFKLYWFLDYVFDKDDSKNVVPYDSIVYRMKQVKTSEDLYNVLKNKPIE